MTVKISPLGSVHPKWDVELQNGILGIILIVIGLILSIYGYSIIGKGMEAKGWQDTEATIVHSDLDEKWISVVAANGNINWKKTYSVDIAYTYFVNHTQYRSNKIGRYKSWDNINQEAKRVLRQYPKWSKFKVYYDPKDPANALLEPNLVLTDFFVLILGGVFVLLGSIAVFKK